MRLRQRLCAQAHHPDTSLNGQALESQYPKCQSGDFCRAFIRHSCPSIRDWRVSVDDLLPLAADKPIGKSNRCRGNIHGNKGTVRSYRPCMLQKVQLQRCVLCLRQCNAFVCVWTGLRRANWCRFPIGANSTYCKGPSMHGRISSRLYWWCRCWERDQYIASKRQHAKHNDAPKNRWQKTPLKLPLTRDWRYKGAHSYDSWSQLKARLPWFRGEHSEDEK